MFFISSDTLGESVDHLSKYITRVSMHSGVMIYTERIFRVKLAEFIYICRGEAR